MVFIGILLFVLCCLTIVTVLILDDVSKQLSRICEHLDPNIEHQVQNLMEQAKHTGKASSD